MKQKTRYGGAVNIEEDPIAFPRRLRMQSIVLKKKILLSPKEKRFSD
jgi:hypothetical protein